MYVVKYPDLVQEIIITVYSPILPLPESGNFTTAYGVYFTIGVKSPNPPNWNANPCKPSVTFYTLTCSSHVWKACSTNAIWGRTTTR